MQKTLIRSFTLLATALIVNSASFAVQNNHHSDHGIIIPSEMKWSDGPDSLPKGAQVAVLEGDLKKPGPFTLRLKFPANYRIAPHWHPVTEHVTVLSGSLYMGMGDNFDENNTTEIPVGGFAYMQPKSHHFAFTRDATEIQLHGVGPWGITYINPKDDPRK